MYGMLLACLGIAMYLFGVLLAIPRDLLGGGEQFLAFNEWIVWYSGMPLVLGLALALLDLFVFFGRKRSPRQEVRHERIADSHVVVALTAYDDEESIGDAVRDFRSHPLVNEVIVVSNNSRDHTMERAEEAGATAVNEPQQGYGRCVYRCFERSDRPQQRIDRRCARATARSGPTTSTSSWPMRRTPTSSTAPAPSNACAPG